MHESVGARPAARVDGHSRGLVYGYDVIVFVEYFYRYVGGLHAVGRGLGELDFKGVSGAQKQLFSTGFPPAITFPAEKLPSSREREILPDRNAASALSARMGSAPSGWTYVRRSGIFRTLSDQILRV